MTIRDDIRTKVMHFLNDQYESVQFEFASPRVLLEAITDFGGKAGEEWDTNGWQYDWGHDAYYNGFKIQLRGCGYDGNASISWAKDDE